MYVCEIPAVICSNFCETSPSQIRNECSSVLSAKYVKIDKRIYVS